MIPDWNGTLFSILLGSSVRVSILALAVALSLLVLRVRSHEVRHAAWTAVMVAMLLMPVLPYCLPSVDIPVPAFQSAVARVEMVTEVLNAPQAAPISAAEATAPAAPETPAGHFSPAPILSVPLPDTPILPLAAAIAYGAGVLIQLFRLFLGWHAVARIFRGCERVRSLRPPSGEVYESPLVATPVTVGLLSPRILLPCGWKQWGGKQLEAVLAHEAAHVRRRDPLVNFLARLNRSLFWPHPLAWWLNSKLAATAEHACDGAAVRWFGDRVRYAELLLEMADSARRSRGRLSWDSAAFHGGLLRRRIDCVLGGESRVEVSWGRKACLALSCVAAIGLVISCRPQPAELKPDPRLEADSMVVRVLPRVRVESAREARELESSLKKGAEDLRAVRVLLDFYETRGINLAGKKETVAALRRLTVWLIRTHPENELNVSAGEKGGHFRRNGWVPVLKGPSAGTR